jgi:photosystem II stability/assembly factor-like uncharacterized protein
MLSRPASVLIAALTGLFTLTGVIPAQSQGTGEDGTSAPTLASAARSLEWRSIGPAVISGRISDLAIHPTQRSTWYVATASGGLWKTTNAGTTFDPIFDDQGSYSIGVVTLSPCTANTVWVGTGENNSQRSVSYGDGVYRSDDGGGSWTNVGLEESSQIGSIVIDPRDCNTVYVAAHGKVFGSGGGGGLYKTTDGGATWELVLETANAWTGVNEVVMDPRDPDMLLAVTWQRNRRQFGYIAGGPGSSVWRSHDGGDTWTESKRGLPSSELGRIALAKSPVNPDVVYAIVEAASNGGFYRSTDNGVSWESRSDHFTIGLYYQEIFADPQNVDRVYSMDTRTWISNDGGESFEILGEANKHVDNHALWIDPDDTDHLIIGCDGGLYESWDRGRTYRWFENLPLGQFYRVEVDSLRPFYRVYGGTQDNSSVGGPSQTRTRRGARSADWFLTQGGDGFYSRIDPTNPNIVYAESQHAGLTRFDLETGERVSIRPEGALDEALVWHWDAPLIISPHNPARLYFAANRVFKTEDRGSSWTYASPDLTKGIDRNRLQMMGRVWGVDAVGKNRSTSVWGAIVSLAESPLQEGLLFAGTDDGMIQISEDGGANWRAIPSIGNAVPDTTFVTDIQPSWHDANTVYVAVDNHKAGDYRPYIAKSTDLGRTWEVIHSDLPERGTVYTILEDIKNPDLLFAGTEFGAYFSNDGGASWSELGAGLPTIQVRDMVFQTQHDDLVIATFGRGFYIFEGLEQLRALTPGFMAGEGGLLPVTDIPMFVASNPDPGWQGATWWSAGNPEGGATFRYYRRDAIRTLKEERERADRAAAERGEDVFYPSWDSLRMEDIEVPAQMILSVHDPEGTLVTRLSGRTSSGVTTVRWNLRYPSATPIGAPGGGGFGGGFFGGGGGAHNGPYIIPGTYTASLGTFQDGVLTELGQPQPFDVFMLFEGERTPEVMAFQKEVQRLQRAVLGANAAAGEAQTMVDDLETAFERVPLDRSDEIQNDIEALRSNLREVQWELNGDPTVRRRAEASPTSMSQRLGRITGGAWSGTLTEVTGMHREQYQVIGSDFGSILERLRVLIEEDLQALQDLADEVGAPWTSGRLPVWSGVRIIS